MTPALYTAFQFVLLYWNTYLPLHTSTFFYPVDIDSKRVSKKKMVGSVKSQVEFQRKIRKSEGDDFITVEVYESQ